MPPTDTAHPAPRRKNDPAANAPSTFFPGSRVAHTACVTAGTRSPAHLASATIKVCVLFYFIYWFSVSGNTCSPAATP
jgi:hypothetical protein